MLAVLAQSVLALLGTLAALRCLPGHVDAQPVEPVDVRPALLPAWQALTTLRAPGGQDIGSSYTLIGESTGVRLTVGPLPDGAHAGYDPRGRRIIVNQDLVGEDPTALATLIRPATLNALLDHVVALARRLKVARRRQLRVDSTVVETTIHHPTDSSLLVDGVRMLERLGPRIRPGRRAGLPRGAAPPDRPRDASPHRHGRQH